jgi:hypothetical protein
LDRVKRAKNVATTGGLYFDFGDRASGGKAKVDWIRSYKNLADIPNN